MNNSEIEIITIPLHEFKASLMKMAGFTAHYIAINHKTNPHEGGRFFLEKEAERMAIDKLKKKKNKNNNNVYAKLKD